jgi:hypothetical protein
MRRNSLKNARQNKLVPDDHPRVRCLPLFKTSVEARHAAKAASSLLGLREIQHALGAARTWSKAASSHTREKVWEGEDREGGREGGGGRTVPELLRAMAACESAGERPGRTAGEEVSVQVDVQVQRRTPPRVILPLQREDQGEVQRETGRQAERQADRQTDDASSLAAASYPPCRSKQ